MKSIVTSLILGLAISGQAMAEGTQLRVFVDSYVLNGSCHGYSLMLENVANLEETVRITKDAERKAKYQIWLDDMKRRLREKAIVQAGTGQALLKGPAQFAIVNNKTEIGSELIARAYIVVPGAKDFDDVLVLPHQGSYSMSFSPTVAGLCPLMREGLTAREAAEKLLNEILQ